MERYFEINRDKHNIRCKLYYNKIPDIKKVIIYTHGFAGHNDNKSAGKLAERILNKYKNVALITFDLPCHGNDVKKKILLADCLTYLNMVIDFAKEKYNTDEIYSCATSFGGYLVLKYISENGNPFKKIALRCPAVNMYNVMLNTILKHGEIEALQKNKSVAVGFDRKVDINMQFLDDLKNADILKNEYFNWAEDIIIIHGTKDEVVDYSAVRKFADDNVIEFVSVENADHRFQNPDCMEQATKAILNFYKL